MLTCVTDVLAADGNQYIVVDQSCTSGMVLVPHEAALALAQNPLAIPLEAAGPMLWATLGLFVAAYCMKVVRKALD